MCLSFCFPRDFLSPPFYITVLFLPSLKPRTPSHPPAAEKRSFPIFSPLISSLPLLPPLFLPPPPLFNPHNSRCAFCLWGETAHWEIHCLDCVWLESRYVKKEEKIPIDCPVTKYIGKLYLLLIDIKGRIIFQSSIMWSYYGRFFLHENLSVSEE